jgi:hypothetical protein
VPKRGGDGDEDRGGGAEPERKENPTENGAETRTKRKLGFFFFFYTRSAREEGNVDNAVRDGGGGISMVHRCGLKNLLMVKVRALEILKLRTTRNNPTKDRPTTSLPNSAQALPVVSCMEDHVMLNAVMKGKRIGSHECKRRKYVSTS